jgi:N-methylhydantoinase A
VILGYLNPAYLVGGALKLNAVRSQEVFEERVARPLRLALPEAAYGAHLIAASNMIRAIKAVSSERGRDPREYVLFAFGGNGPLFAAGMARQLEMTRIVVPPAPGLFSSFGLLYGDVEHHYVRTYRRPTRALDLAELNGIVGKMDAEALGQLAAEGFTGVAARIKRSADLCYQGQSFELTVPLAAGTLDARAITELEEVFGREHERVYGHRAGPDEPVQLVSLRVVAHGIPDRARVPDRVVVDRHPPTLAGEPPPRRRVYFGAEHGWQDTPILRRGELEKSVDGPAIVEEYDATSVIPPRATARLDAYANIVIDLGG